MESSISLVIDPNSYYRLPTNQKLVTISLEGKLAISLQVDDMTVHNLSLPINTLYETGIININLAGCPQESHKNSYIKI